MLSGDLPELVRHFFFSAKLIALEKKGGGVRPIAVGSVFRRLASKMACRAVIPTLTPLMCPIQLGVGTPGGCEAAIHGIRAFNHVNNNTPHIIVKLDIRNAFNTILRDSILENCLEFCPEIYNYILSSYAKPSTLVHGPYHISSSSGVQQGDPLGPVLFCLGINHIVKNCSTPLNVWYLDDCTLGGHPETVLKTLVDLIPRLEFVGLILNTSKSEIINFGFSRDEFEVIVSSFIEIIPGASITPSISLEILGCPLTDGGIKDALETKEMLLEKTFVRLNLLDSHTAFFLLKNALGIQKLNHVLRGSPCFLENDQLHSINVLFRKTTERIIKIKFDDQGWKQASLPVSFGGLGIRNPTDVSRPAFLSSLYSSQTLVQKILHLLPESSLPKMTAYFDSWSAKESKLPSDFCSQKSYDKIVCEGRFVSLLKTSNQHRRACLLAGRSTGSGEWLEAFPIGSLGTLLDPDTLRVGVGLRIGLKVCEPHKCRCGASIDQFGLHPLSCRESAGRFPRHSALNDVIRRALDSIGFPSVLEPPGLDRGDGKRPDGMTIFPFLEGKPLVWDSTCSDSLSKTNMLESACNAGTAADRRGNMMGSPIVSFSGRLLSKPWDRLGRSRCASSGVLDVSRP
ncbi:uncharacterized protein LOC115227355 [Octopus sinensis]|uniref:Uncharacterized protein LOC115227355 n=1 Tax=Octopus sinensis TaxID=2607531 RepID=A0A6P7TVY3_9MOLL|nr:uncharacterized protein LOC115227355 [Octopus sinensis]